MAKIYVLIEIGEYYPKSAMDHDRPIYIDLIGQTEEEKLALKSFIIQKLGERK